MVLFNKNYGMNKIKDIFSKFKIFLKEHHESTFLGMALGDSTKEEWENAKEINFEKAKKVSDFVAILIRAAFVYLCFLFFSHQAKEVEFWFYKQALGICSYLAFALYVVIFLGVLRVITAYWLSDTAHSKNRFYKVVITILALNITFATGYGITVLVRKFAEVSSLLNAIS